MEKTLLKRKNQNKWKWGGNENLSVIRQKGEYQNGGNTKTKHAKFSKKKNEHFLPTDKGG